MINKRRQRKSKLPKPVDPTRDRDEPFEVQWRNPQLRDLHRPRHIGGWLSKLHGIRCEHCKAVNRKLAKYCDQCGTQLEEQNHDVDTSPSESAESGD